MGECASKMHKTKQSGQPCKCCRNVLVNRTFWIWHSLQ